MVGRLSHPSALALRKEDALVQMMGAAITYGIELGNDDYPVSALVALAALIASVEKLRNLYTKHSRTWVLFDQQRIGLEMAFTQLSLRPEEARA